jgi:hypothetical protein
MPGYPSPIPLKALASQLDEPKVGRSPLEAGIRGFGAGALEALGGLMGGDDPSGQLMGVAGPLGMVAQPTRRIPAFLEDLFAANPEARGAYERAMAAQGAEADQYLATQAPEVLGGLPARQDESLEMAGRANQALQGLAQGGIARPIPSRTGFETAIPTGGGKPPISGRWGRWSGKPTLGVD